MEQQITFEREGLAALCTSKRTFACVTSHVVYEVFLACKRLRTHVTAVRCFARVLAQMIGEVFFTCKRLLAKFATMWRLTGVYAYVIS